LEVLNVVETRWLSLSNVVGNLHSMRLRQNPLFYEDSLGGEKAAANLILLLNEDFIIVTMFLADLTILKRLNKIFQADYVALSHIKPHLKAATDYIFANFIGNSDIKPT